MINGDGDHDHFLAFCVLEETTRTTA